MLPHDRLPTSSEDARRFEALRRWVNLHLPIPDQFSLSQGKQAHRRAICWLKAEAAKYVGKVREFFVEPAEQPNRVAHFLLARGSFQPLVARHDQVASVAPAAPTR